MIRSRYTCSVLLREALGSVLQLGAGVCQANNCSLLGEQGLHEAF